MGPINWLAVVLAAVLAAGVLRLFWGAGGALWPYALQLIPAALLGHALARIGPEKLAVKPHLYTMQAAGLALAIVIPALWMAGKRAGAGSTALWRDSAAFLCAYLVMGAVFWVMG